MAFINPYLLWGSLAVAIPILLHFWHQKRGRLLDWAATQWLTGKKQQQQRGVKFDNLLLLVLRSLLVLLLAVLLSRPFFNGGTTPQAVEQIHLVQPTARLVDTFRFELESALKKGEKLYWATAVPEPVKTLAIPPQPGTFSPLSLQSAIDNLSLAHAQLNLYVLNTQRLAAVPFIYVPAHFKLHTIADSAGLPRRFLTADQRNVFVDGANRLANGPVLPQTVRFVPAAVHEGPLSVEIRFRNRAEQQTVEAALDALTDVYKLTLTITDQPLPGKRTDVVVTDQLPPDPSSQTLYIVSGAAQPAQAANVVWVSGPLTQQTSELVAGGRLPEWLGERLVDYFGLQPTQVPLSQQELKALFVTGRAPGLNPVADESSLPVHGGLLLAFICLIGVERWLALTKNA